MIFMVLSARDDRNFATIVDIIINNVSMIEEQYFSAIAEDNEDVLTTTELGSRYYPELGLIENLRRAHPQLQ